MLQYNLVAMKSGKKPLVGQLMRQQKGRETWQITHDEMQRCNRAVKSALVMKTISQGATMYSLLRAR